MFYSTWIASASTVCAFIIAATVLSRRKSRARRQAAPVKVSVLARRVTSRHIDRRVVVGALLAAFIVIFLERDRLRDAWHDRDRGSVEAGLNDLERSGDWYGVMKLAAARLEQPASADWRIRLERRRMYAQLEASLVVSSTAAAPLLDDATGAADRIGLPSQLSSALGDRLQQAGRTRALARAFIDSQARHASHFADYPPVARQYWQDALKIAEDCELPADEIAKSLAAIPSPRRLPAGTQFDVLHRRTTGLVWEFDLLIRDGDGKAVRGLTQTDFVVRSGAEPLTGWRVAEQRELAAEHSIAVVLDCSNSTQGAPLALAKQGAWRLLDEVIDQSPVSLYAFGTKVTRVVEWTRNRTQATAALQSLSTQGETALLQSLRRAVDDLSSRPGRRSLVVFTDGRDTVGGLTWDELAADIKRHGVSFFAVALETADLDFMPLRTLAESTGGLAFTADDRQLVNRFQAIAESLRVHLYRLVLLDDTTVPGPLTITVGDPPLELQFEIESPRY